MKVSNRRLGLYRALYWANQGLLRAVGALQDAKLSDPSPLNDQLKRTQDMIEKTRELINRVLTEWIQSD